MYLLGISGGVLAGNQDASAALLKDGVVVAAAEEERLLGLKHANGQLPKKAIEFCLERAGIGIRDVAAVGSPGITYRDWTRILRDYFVFHFGHAPEIELFDHHTCHAASSYYFSNLQDALVFTADFSGDRTCTALFEARGNTIRQILRMQKPHSLGIFYSILTQYLGFGKDDEEYKVMGLASYGEPRYDLSELMRVEGEAYEVNPRYVRGALHPDLPAPSKQEALFEPLPLPRSHRVAGEKLEQYHMDVAASGQKLLEDAALNLLRHAAKDVASRNLCLAGGVTLNCVMNQKIHEAGLFDDIFVPPHTSDAGLALGAAAFLSLARAGRRPLPMAHCFWGPSYGDEEIEKLLRACGAPYRRPDDIAAAVADELARGSIVGWFQQGLEFGPRALGGRSILADPRQPDMKDRVNLAVKFREGFRPFAPSVLEAEADAWFEGCRPTPYMTMTFDVKPAKRALVPAITHVDGTARVQTVSSTGSPHYHDVISKFARLTGVPMVLNTSMNVKGQPIVADPRTALSLFYGTGLGSMAIGPYLLKK